MNINPDSPAKEITIAGQTFIVPEPFAEGHTLTANEAAVLNQTFAENIRNNMASRVKAGLSADTEDAPVTQDDVDTYIASYEFGVRRSGSGPKAPVDPVERETYKLAADHVKAALRKKGVALKDFDKDKLHELVLGVIAKYPQLREKAEQIVALKAGVAGDELDLGV